MKKSILVPTDFSENSWIAIQYAAKLASAIQAKLTIIHIYQSFYSVFANEKFNTEIHKHTEEMVNNEMKTLLSKLESETPAVQVDGQCKSGVLHITLNELIQEEHYDLIVMGTRGATGFKSVIIGSNTLNVINNSSIPILAVPEDATFNGINNVGLLSNYKNGEIDVLKRSIKVIPSSFALTLLHIRESENEDEEAILEAWKGVIQDKTGIKDVAFKIDIGNELPSVINKMIEEEGIDLLIVTNNGKSFFKRLFDRNLIRSIALRPQIPVLFIKP